MRLFHCDDELPSVLQFLPTACHFQAAVKALRGVQFARDANGDFDVGCSNSLLYLSRGIDDRSVVDHVTALTNQFGDRNALQYPSVRGATSGIPHDLFSAATASQARGHCTAIVEWCRNFIRDSWPL